MTSVDTIFARASGAGRAGVCVYRVCGPAAFEIAQRLTGKKLPIREAKLVNINCPDTEQLVDRGLVILFKGPGSFTGEDTAEIQLHGSVAVETALLAALTKTGARPAEAGEFTKRALLNGKMDLAQVEALSDLIDSETDEQRKQALGQLDGRLSAVAEAWRAHLLAILAPLEADVDFPDEDAVPAAVAMRAGPQIDALIAELKTYRSASSAARAIRVGVKVAIMGRANAGKSSLVNALTGTDAAIVSAQPGTTRDVIEVRLDIDGVPVIVADTAGLRDQSTDEVELEGMRRAVHRAQAADIRIMVIDPLTDGFKFDLSAAPGGQTMRPGDFIVWSKSDLVEAGSDLKNGRVINGMANFQLSAKTGDGLDRLLSALSAHIAELVDQLPDGPLTRARHVAAVETAIDGLTRAREMVAQNAELAAEDVRLAVRALGGITGAVDVEEVLGEIFSSFCIGK